MKKEKAIVIGAGVAGMATAIRLAVSGQHVEVYEATNAPGGKLGLITQAGYRFDAGPSLFTLPALVEELFSLADVPMEGFFKYKSLDETCRYFWSDGTKVTGFSDKAKFALELEEKLGEPASITLTALGKAEHEYNLVGKIFLNKSLHRLKTWLSWDVAYSLLRLPLQGLTQSMHLQNLHRFRSEKTVQLFDRFATYNGSNPYEAPALLNMIPHLEHNIGVFYPEGGMYSITKALYGLALHLGVTFHFDNPVDRIQVSEGKTNGILLKNGQEINADLVISNVDMVATYRKLMPAGLAPEKLLNQPKSSSALIFYWGVKGSFPELGLHNILFSDRYYREFEALFKFKKLFNDPTVYINITSKHTPGDAPAGCENWFVMINAPHAQGQDWETLRTEARQYILAKIQQCLGIDLAPLIEAEFVLDPPGIESRTGSSQGALYGNASNTRFAAFLRHANWSKDVKNLYFAGGSVHPGGGVPLALLSGKITSELIAEGVGRA